MAAFFLFGKAFPAECPHPPCAPFVAVLKPLDESEKVKDLSRFLAKLRTAVKKRDSAYVKSVQAPDIRLSLGPDGDNPAADTPGWSDPENPRWQELETVLSLGGGFISTGGDSLFCMPYLYAAFPPALDAFEHQVVVKPSTRARTSPADTAKAIALPDYMIVRTDPGYATLVEGAGGRHWARIYLEGKAAYVPPDCLRSPIGARACFQKRGRQWKIHSMIEGD